MKKKRRKKKQSWPKSRTKIEKPVDLYITFSGKDEIKRCFLNLRKYLIISADDVINEIGYAEKELDDCVRFLVNEEIKKIIKRGSVRRKLLALIYSNPSMNDEIIRELIHYANSLPSIRRVIFLVEKGEKESYYELFGEVLFFPAVKKVHIVECTPVPVEWIGISEKIDESTFF